MSTTDKTHVIEVVGRYTEMVFVFGPYTKADADAAYARMVSGQTMHTTKTVRPYVKGEHTL